MERDGVRSEDSFESFEEVLRIAKDKNVSLKRAAEYGFEEGR